MKKLFICLSIVILLFNRCKEDSILTPHTRPLLKDIGQSPSKFNYKSVITAEKMQLILTKSPNAKEIFEKLRKEFEIYYNDDRQSLFLQRKGISRNLNHDYYNFAYFSGVCICSGSVSNQNNNDLAIDDKCIWFENAGSINLASVEAIEVSSAQGSVASGNNVWLKGSGIVRPRSEFLEYWVNAAENSPEDFIKKN